MVIKADDVCLFSLVSVNISWKGIQGQLSLWYTVAVCYILEDGTFILPSIDIT